MDMVTRILYSITEWLLKILKTRGVDISTLNPKTKREVVIEGEINKLRELQSEISIKRGEIIQEQNELMSMVEPTLFNILSESKDSWEKTSVTKLWFDKLSVINDMVGEHETLVKHFEDTYTKIEKLKTNYEV
jgi:hypothetical protein